MTISVRTLGSLSIFITGIFWIAVGYVAYEPLKSDLSSYSHWLKLSVLSKP